MSDISALAQLSTGVTSLSNLVLVSPKDVIGYQPQNSGKSTPAAKALLFHYEGENTVTLDSDITDHFVEDNTALNDQISLRPELITVHGYIGELNDVVPELLEPLKTAADKLTAIVGYAPDLSATAILAYNEAALTYQLAANAAISAVSALDALSSDGGAGQAVIGSDSILNTNQFTQGLQEKMFQQFYGYWKKRTLFTVQTPWAVFTDCAIKTVRAIQDSETRMITSFEVTFKPMRFASTVISGQTNLAGDTSQGQLVAQSSPEVNLGKQAPGEDVPLSFA